MEYIRIQNSGATSPASPDPETPDPETPDPATLDLAAPAVWSPRLRWLKAIGLALIPVVFTAAASAVSQVARTGDLATVLVVALGAALSAVIGVIVMVVSRPSLRQYGLRLPRRVASVGWLVPLLITVVIAAVTQGVHVSWTLAAAYLVLTVAVGINEEVWFRGIVLATLRSAGTRVAVIGTSVLFGVLHLSNLAGGEHPAAAALQLAFAVLFGLVAAELAVLTRSLWPAIIWHAAWDFTNYLGGNATGPVALIGVGVVCGVLVAYAIVLWRRTPTASADTPAAPVAP